MLQYVIDLQVIWFAWTGKAPREQRDTDCADLWLMIQRTCERVLVTDEIDKKYRDVFDQLRQKYPQGPRLLNAFTLYFLWKQSKKVDDSRLSNQIPPLNDESHLEEEDRKFARLAKLTNSVLVTHDSGILKFASTLGYTAMTPLEVISAH